MVNIRPAEKKDLPAVTEIYNQAVLATTATFDTEPRTLAAMEAWFEGHGPGHPVLVAEQAGEVVGWAALSKWSDKKAYAGTAEVSLYLHEAYRGQGIGRKLLEALVQAGEAAGLRTVVAWISQGNEVSLHLHESLGFKQIGVLDQVGRKFDRLLGVHLMQKIYGREES